jgi:tetratricopeptide (TPR) repeat protein
MNNLAYSYDEDGRSREALKLREQVLELRRKTLGPEHPDTLKSMTALAISYDVDYRWVEALQLRERTLALSLKVNGPEHPNTLEAMHNLAISYVEAGRLPEAFKLREEVLALCRKVNGPEHPDTLAAMNRLAFSYEGAGRRDEALKLQEQVLALRRKTLGPEHPDTLQSINPLALSYESTGRWDDVLKLREEVVMMQRQHFGNDSSVLAAALFTLGNTLKSQNRPAEAAQKYRESLDILLKPHWEEQISKLSIWVVPELIEAGDKQQATNICRAMLNSNSTNAAWFNSASWCLATTENPTNRDPALAVELAKRAVKLDPKTPSWWNTLGTAAYRAGDFKTAFADLEKCVQLQQWASSYDFFFLAMTVHQLGKADAAQRYYAKAIQWMMNYRPHDAELLRFRAEAERLLSAEVKTGAESPFPVPPGAK